MFQPRFVIVFICCFFLSSVAMAAAKKPNANSSLFKSNKRQVMSYAELRKLMTESLVCMAKNIYFEAGIESRQGKIAVANVTITRMKSRFYPNTICDVVYQKNQITCAFSWTCDGKSDQPPKNSIAYRESVKIARLAIAGLLKNITGHADHYHANYVKPSWSDSMTRKIEIGSHIFYKKYNS